MSLRVKSTIGAAILVSPWAFMWTLSSGGQTPPDNQTAPQVLLSSSVSTAPEEPGAGTIVREINDPSTGDRWLLVRASRRPGAPGRLILVAAQAVSPARPGQLAPSLPVPVIHTGDRLIVEENTSLVQARLEAVALNPAPSGAPLKVRLVPSGTLARAVALGPGRAALALETGNRQ
jgi:hypothetical protein